MAFCDVTLRLPASGPDLTGALTIALENHAYWRDARDAARPLPRA